MLKPFHYRPQFISAVLLTVLLTGCLPFFVYTNKKFEPQRDPKAVRRASFRIEDNRGNKKVLMILALSGGGSRAAYFSSRVMFHLERVFEKEINLLKEVDVISAVSGGTLPAAYYCISKDPDAEKQGKSGKIWEEEHVKRLMSRSFTIRWFGNWFWPHNIVRYWFTKFDRSDIMADTFGNNLFNAHFWGRDIAFSELERERPYLIINATNATDEKGNNDMPFGSVFTFTEEDFKDKINSDIRSYSIAKAVMASAAFPLVFNDVTLRNFNAMPPNESIGDDNEKKAMEQYLHVFDGGNADNLGLKSIKRALLENDLNIYKKIIVISVDVSKRPRGVDSKLKDRRKNLLNYIIDTNLSESFDMFMNDRRLQLLREFKKGIFEFDRDCEQRSLPERFCIEGKGLRDEFKEKREWLKKNLVFFHVNFKDIKDPKDYKIEKKVNNISTDFKISDDEEELRDSEKLEAGSKLFIPEEKGGASILEIKKEIKINAHWLDMAAEDLINEENKCLQKIRDILLDRYHDSSDKEDPCCKDCKE